MTTWSCQALPDTQ